ncbi:MAG: hypothetical protein CM1200mP10_05910 [Candidatus Neomarinimicrobiota bacterium]|nr:MAG: hypothetical protein CM1200mP10_05910 [Candidatus Neomarinimicrobiota bacterium]
MAVLMTFIEVGEQFWAWTLPMEDISLTEVKLIFPVNYIILYLPVKKETGRVDFDQVLSWLGNINQN